MDLGRKFKYKHETLPCHPAFLPWPPLFLYTQTPLPSTAGLQGESVSCGSSCRRLLEKRNFLRCGGERENRNQDCLGPGNIQVLLHSQSQLTLMSIQAEKAEVYSMLRRGREGGTLFSLATKGCNTFSRGSSQRQEYSHESGHQVSVP